MSVHFRISILAGISAGDGENGEDVVNIVLPIFSARLK